MKLGNTIPPRKLGKFSGGPDRDITEEPVNQHLDRNSVL